jgi:hypothetical protein
MTAIVAGILRYLADSMTSPLQVFKIYMAPAFLEYVAVNPRKM